MFMSFWIWHMTNSWWCMWIWVYMPTSPFYSTRMPCHSQECICTSLFCNAQGISQSTKKKHCNKNSRNCTVLLRWILGRNPSNIDASGKSAKAWPAIISLCATTRTCRLIIWPIGGRPQTWRMPCTRGFRRLTTRIITRIVPFGRRTVLSSNCVIWKSAGHFPNDGPMRFGLRRCGFSPGDPISFPWTTSRVLIPRCWKRPIRRSDLTTSASI